MAITVQVRVIATINDFQTTTSAEGEVVFPNRLHLRGTVEDRTFERSRSRFEAIHIGAFDLSDLRSTRKARSSATTPASRSRNTS